MRLLRLNLSPDARKLRSYLISKFLNHVLTPFLEGEGVAAKVRSSLNPCINRCGYIVAVFLPILPKNRLSILPDESTWVEGQRHEPIFARRIIIVAYPERRDVKPLFPAIIESTIRINDSKPKLFALHLARPKKSTWKRRLEIGESRTIEFKSNFQ